MKKTRFGFTLIELLIVIALLGALAVGLLAALDPFEQLKKGTDTGVRNTVSELHGAIIRYYGIKNYMPWCNDATCSAPLNGISAPGDIATAITALTLHGGAGHTPTSADTEYQISSAGELKSNFGQLAGDGTLEKIKLIGSQTNATVVVCYQPTAKSFINDPNTKFLPSTLQENTVTSGAGACKKDSGGAVDCLWCVQ